MKKLIVITMLMSGMLNAAEEDTPTRRHRRRPLTISHKEVNEDVEPTPIDIEALDSEQIQKIKQAYLDIEKKEDSERRKAEREALEHDPRLESFQENPYTRHKDFPGTFYKADALRLVKPPFATFQDPESGENLIELRIYDANTKHQENAYTFPTLQQPNNLWIQPQNLQLPSMTEPNMIKALKKDANQDLKKHFFNFITQHIQQNDLKNVLRYLKDYRLVPDQSIDISEDIPQPVLPKFDVKSIIANLKFSDELPIDPKQTHSHSQKPFPWEF